MPFNRESLSDARAALLEAAEAVAEDVSLDLRFGADLVLKWLRYESRSCKAIGESTEKG